MSNNEEKALNWWNKLRQMTILQGNGTGGLRRSWDLVNKYFPDQIPSGKGIALLELWQIEHIWRKKTGGDFSQIPDSHINTDFDDDDISTFLKTK